MRWTLGVLAICAALGGGVVGAGFLLPTRLETSAEIVIERPRATVFALANDLRTMTEISPVRAADPEAVFRVNREAPGEGQALRWRSALERFGAGEIVIAQSEPHAEVAFEVRRDGAAPVQTAIDIAPMGDAAAVTATWRYTTQCGESWRDLACRYVSMLERGEVRRAIASALERLKRTAERLPAADFETLRVERVEASARDILFMEGEAQDDPARIEEALGETFARVRSFAAQAQLREAGPLIAIAGEAGAGVYSFRAGLPFEGPAPLASLEVRVGRTPAGPALKVVHEGTTATLAETYERMDAYVRAHRLALRGEAWEVFHPGRDGAPPRVEIWRALAAAPVEAASAAHGGL